MQEYARMGEKRRQWATMGDLSLVVLVFFWLICGLYVIIDSFLRKGERIVVFVACFEWCNGGLMV